MKTNSLHFKFFLSLSVLVLVVMGGFILNNWVWPTKNPSPHSPSPETLSSAANLQSSSRPLATEPVLPRRSESNSQISLVATQDWKGVVAMLADAASPLEKRVTAAERLGRNRVQEAFVPFADIVTNAAEHVLLRCYAARGLGALGNEHAVNPLASVLYDAAGDKNLRAASALALGSLKTESAVSALRNSTSDPDSLIRFKAIQALERTGKASAVEPVLAALSDSDIYARARAIHALGNLHDESSLPVLKTLLESDESSDFIRIACLNSLGNLGGAKAIELLQAYQPSSNQLLQINANSALRRIKTRPAHEN